MLPLMVIRLRRLCAVLVVLAVVAACADTSGCANFRDASQPMKVGSTQEVLVEVVGGAVPSIDVNGGIYLQAEGSPRLKAEDGAHRVVVRNTPSGLRMTVGEQTISLADEPIGCD